MQRDANDDRWAEALRATPLPPGLRDSLLKPQLGPERRLRKVTRRPLVAVIGAAAALLIVFAGLWKIAWAPQQHFREEPRFRTAMAYYIAKVPFRLDFTSQNLGAIQQWLDDAETPTLPPIPKALGQRLPLGCKRIQWGDTTVSLVCFFESIPDGRIVHLFIAPRAALADPAFAELRETVVQYDLETRGWSTDDWVCVLVPSDPAMRIAHFLDQPEFTTPAA